MLSRDNKKRRKSKVFHIFRGTTLLRPEGARSRGQHLLTLLREYPSVITLFPISWQPLHGDLHRSFLVSCTHRHFSEEERNPTTRPYHCVFSIISTARTFVNQKMTFLLRKAVFRLQGVVFAIIFRKIQRLHSFGNAFARVISKAPALFFFFPYSSFGA